MKIIVKVSLIVGFVVFCIFYDFDRLKVSDSLDVVDMPEGFEPEADSIVMCDVEGKKGVGTRQMLVVSDVEAGTYSIDVFSGESTIADLSWLVTRLYNEVLSDCVCSGESLSQEAVAMLEFSFIVQSSFIHAATAAFLKNAIDIDVVKEKINSYYLHCNVESTIWDDDVYDTINTLCLKWLKRAKGESASRIGERFKACDSKWLMYIIKKIENEDIVDIRWPNLVEDKRFFLKRWLSNGPKNRVHLDFNDAYAFNRDWKEICTVVYFEAARSLQRMVKEITSALSRVRDVGGYPQLHELIEKWRPYLNYQLNVFCHVYSDMPLVVLSKVAFNESKKCDKLFSTDREKVKSIAADYVRLICDGAMLKFSCSATSGHLFNDYHAYLKKMLGKADYESLKNSLRWRKKDALSYE